MIVYAMPPYLPRWVVAFLAAAVLAASPAASTMPASPLLLPAGHPDQLPSSPPASPAGSEADACNVSGVTRIVAVGDVHGAYDSFVSILQAAGVVDRRASWIGGTTHLVQTGDVVDRGPRPRKVLDLLMRLEEEAPKAGGRVHALIGNHEVAVVLGDLRSTSAKEYEEFRTPDSKEVRERYYHMLLTEVREKAALAGREIDERRFRDEFLEKTPLGWVERRVAFGPTGTYGRWLRERNTVVKLNRVLFIHAGISPEVVRHGCEGINETVRADLTKNFDETIRTPLQTLVASPDGPLWYRGLSETGADAETRLEEVLERFDARAIVAAHSVVGSGRIASRFGGRLFLIDTGMLSDVYHGGRPSALEIVGEGANAIYLDGRIPLAFAPDTASTPGLTASARR